MNRLSIILCLCMICNVCFGAKQWPNHYQGGDEKLFYSQKTIDEIRERIDKYQWARDLYKKLGEEIALGEKVYVWETNTKFPRALWTKDAALYYRISGDRSQLKKVVDNIVGAFNLKKLDKPLFRTDTTKNNQFFWEFGWSRCAYLTAYDLIKNCDLMAPYREAMNVRIKEVIEEAFRYERRIKRLGNTHLWGVTALGVFGFMDSNQRAIDVAINGKNGFKAALDLFRDEGRFWPEPMHYTYGYVDCCMLMLAELAHINGYAEDLFNYQAPNGASMLRAYYSFLDASGTDGYGFGNGDHGEYPLDVNGKIYVEGTPVISLKKTVYRSQHKEEVYHAYYGTPTTAWVVAQNPRRDGKCWSFYGYSSLTHGRPADGGKTPDARSIVFPEMGNAFIKSVQGPDYWWSKSITVHMRNGASQQFHSNNDHFAITINAFEKNIYNDWFLRWDYLAPRKGRPNNTPISPRILNHNTVMVDFKEPDVSLIKYSSKKPEIAGEKFSQISEQGPMQSISCEGSIYAGVEEKRTIFVTQEYVLDLFELSSDKPHTYEYLLHSLGKVAVSGVGEWRDYPKLSQEYGLYEIDHTSLREDRWWLMDSKIATAKSDLHFDFIDVDNIGVYTTLLQEDGSEVISTRLPYLVSTEGWDKTSIRTRRPMVSVRRFAANTTFLALHQPYQKRLTNPLTIVRKGDKVIVKGKKFEDTYDLTTGKFVRK